MKNLRLFLIALALPAILPVYIIWVTWFQTKYEKVPNEYDEQYFINNHVGLILVIYYTIFSAWLCMSLLT